MRHRRGVLGVVAVGASIALTAVGTGSHAAVETPRVEWAVPGAGHGTPAVDAESAYFLGRRHEVTALDPRTGSERWRQESGSVGPETLGAKVLVSGEVVIAADGGLVGLNRTTGTVVWSFRPKEGREPGLYLGQVAKGLVLAGSVDGYLHGVDTRTGRARWSRRVVDGTVFAPSVTPGGVIIAGFRNRNTPARGGVVAIETESGIERWRHGFLPWRGVRADTGATGSAIVCGSVVVIGGEDGTIHGLDPLTGHVRWVIPPLASRPDQGPPPSQDHRPVACQGDTLVIGSLTGQIVAVDIRTRRERWHVAPWPSSVAFGLATDEYSVFVPYLSGHLIALALTDGSERWRTGGAAAGLVWTPLVYDSRLFVAGSGAGFMALHR